MTTMNDVAKLAGVSVATVSRVLSNKPHVRDELRQKVLIAVEQLNYKPNMLARRLREQTSGIIGLVVADIRNPFFAEISRAVEDVAYDHEYSIFLCNTDERPEKERQYLDLLSSESIAGLIIAPTKATAKKLGQLKLNYPMVVIDRATELSDTFNVDQVLLDNVDAAYRLTTHLLDEIGPRIGAVFGAQSYTGDQRLDGYLRAMEEYQVEVPSEWIQRVSPHLEAGFLGAQTLLRLRANLDGIVTSNSLLAAGALKAINEAGLLLPEDIALACFDDATWTTLVRSPITVISQPTYEIGKMATELLLQRIDKPTLHTREVVLRGRLIIRASTVTNVK